MTDNVRDVIIVGGGPAGASSAIVLAGRGHRVLILDRSYRPGLKVCGEFLSPDALVELTRLVTECSGGQTPSDIEKDKKILESLPQIPFVGIAHGFTRVRSSLEPPGRGIRRTILDGMLLKWSHECGAEFHPGCEVVGVKQEEGMWSIHARDRMRRTLKQYRARGVVIACGRRRVSVDPLLENVNPDRAVFIGFQSTLDSYPYQDEVSLYFFDNGYLGVAPVSQDRWNLCGIIRIEGIQRGKKGLTEGIRRWYESSPFLHKWLNRDPENLFERVTTLPSFLVRSPVINGLPCAGDYAGSIHPFCGDGIAIALQSGRLAGEWLDRYLCGEVTWHEMLRAYHGGWVSMFINRFRWSRWLNRVVSHRWLRKVGTLFIHRLPESLDFFYRKTRGLP